MYLALYYIFQVICVYINLLIWIPTNLLLTSPVWIRVSCVLLMISPLFMIVWTLMNIGRVIFTFLQVLMMSLRLIRRVVMLTLRLFKL
ncbi:TPA_asm: P overlapped [Conopholis alphacytorhabdovirus 1]|nr:TPA_asm: P overlapped [Conopholis alphacytorhabdovirus 1]